MKFYESVNDQHVRATVVYYNSENGAASLAYKDWHCEEGDEFTASELKDAYIKGAFLKNMHGLNGPEEGFYETPLGMMPNSNGKAIVISARISGGEIQYINIRSIPDNVYDLKNASFSVEFPENYMIGSSNITVETFQIDASIDKKNHVTGWLNYVTDFTDFDVDTDKQSGNYLAFSIVPPKNVVSYNWTITDDNGNEIDKYYADNKVNNKITDIIVRLGDGVNALSTNTLNIQITSNGYETITKVLDVRGLDYTPATTP